MISLENKQLRSYALEPAGSVAAKFEVMAYSKLAPPKISNLCIFEYICIRIYMVILWMIIEYGPLLTAAP